MQQIYIFKSLKKPHRGLWFQQHLRLRYYEKLKKSTQKEEVTFKTKGREKKLSKGNSKKYGHYLKKRKGRFG